jgi:hypothetical protein
MIRRFVVAAAVFLVISQATPAFADATAFLGMHTNPDRQVMKGFAVGFGVLILGFEGEYGSAGEDDSAGLPSLKTFSGNVLLQTPVPVFGTRFYFTTGIGGYREELDAIDHSETNVVYNTGGGAKITLIGPLRVRLDYRLMKLQGEPVRPSTVHRIYAGINLAF